ncbi:MAG: MFS transporter [Gammaproteobacteria bacterium]|nr:MFS transporter [Gammaproteobacteria bacterium]
MSSSKPAPFFETLQLYRDKRLWFVFLLGCSSGFPWVLIGSAMTGWLKDANLTRAAISYLGSVTAIYAFNFLWAPLVDRVHIFGRQRLGQRRSWILWMQLAIVSLTIAMSYSNPANSVILTSALALSIGLFAATMDVAIDGYRIDIFAGEANFLPAAAAMAVAGWWTGYSLPGYVAFHYADQIGWPAAYQLLAFMLLVLVVVTLLIPEPANNRDLLQQKAAERYHKALRHPVSLWLTITVVEPFADFFRRNGFKVALTLIAFILVFKIGEAFLGRMSIQFYREIGFSNEQIADYSKLIGWGATIAFTLLGSLINMRFGVMKGLVIGGITMAGSNLMFAWIAQVGPNETLLLCTILVDNFTTAFSAVAFVAFLTSFTGVAFSASQYALLASIGNFGRTSMAAVSGEFVDWLNGDWTLFFILTSLMVVPGLLLLWSIDRKLKAKKPSTESA